MNILFFCSPLSIHDQKWFYRISKLNNIRVFIISDKPDYLSNKVFRDTCRENNIILLPSLCPYSIKHHYRTKASINKINEYITTHGIDLVHFMFATPYAFYSNHIKIPYIITTRGSDVLIVAPSLLKTKGVRGLHDKLLFRKLKKAFNNAEAITSTSNKQKSEIQILFGTDDKKLNIIPTGINIESIINENTNSLPDKLLGTRIIFFPRYVKPIYNTYLQIEAIGLLPQEILESITFVFIRGDEIETQYQREAIEKLNKIKGIKYHLFDKLSQKQMWSIYNAAELTIMTPVSDGTPNSALEAMIARSGLILGNLDYDKNIFNEYTCIKLSDNNAKELAKSIENCLSNYPSTKKDKAFETVVKYADIHQSIKTIISIYNKLSPKRTQVLARKL
jgi:glycosyltransferase involved in cell wall biosynthesis